ncbi:hypothetical protein Q3G72_008087 [Acer saccharum]|nr:hypothetical protein Q3G72_008087 [Acer saccharum]
MIKSKKRRKRRERKEEKREPSLTLVVAAARRRLAPLSSSLQREKRREEIAVTSHLSRHRCRSPSACHPSPCHCRCRRIHPFIPQLALLVVNKFLPVPLFKAFLKDARKAAASILEDPNTAGRAGQR